ncbi:hypothetical protein [Bradyrhizobium sp. S3.9.1]|uniref:hypothetical protein n=1 Tax=Bradyrhizobium sp. S3.9.1 TaxID=3156431 RepID=UPI003395C539
MFETPFLFVRDREVLMIASALYCQFRQSESKQSGPVGSATADQIGEQSVVAIDHCAGTAAQ